MYVHKVTAVVEAVLRCVENLDSSSYVVYQILELLSYSYLYEDVYPA